MQKIENLRASDPKNEKKEVFSAKSEHVPQKFELQQLPHRKQSQFQRIIDYSISNRRILAHVARKFGVIQ